MISFQTQSAPISEQTLASEAKLLATTSNVRFICGGLTVNPESARSYPTRRRYDEINKMSKLDSMYHKIEPTIFFRFHLVLGYVPGQQQR